MADDNFEQLVLSGDFHVVAVEDGKKNISVEQIRDLIKMLSLGSFGGNHKIAVIKDAEKLSLEAANALLKTLEEPEKDVLIILLCSDLEMIPKTIASRCQILNLLPVNGDLIYDYLIAKHQTSRDDAKILSRLAVGRPALAMKFLEDQTFYKNYLKKIDDFFLIFGVSSENAWGNLNKLNKISVEDTFDLLLVWQLLWRDILLLKLQKEELVQHVVAIDRLKSLVIDLPIIKIKEILASFNQAKKYLQANVSPKNVLENILVSLI
jgi:DNA polymerase-3 subunit delta'